MFAKCAGVKPLVPRERVRRTKLSDEGLRATESPDAPNTPEPRKRRPMPTFDGKSGLVPGLGGLRTQELLDTAD